MTGPHGSAPEPCPCCGCPLERRLAWTDEDGEWWEDTCFGCTVAGCDVRVGLACVLSEGTRRILEG